MQQNNTRDWSREIPSSLNFSQEQVAFVLGHSLRSLYDDVLAADMPEHLKALVLKLEEKYPLCEGTSGPGDFGCPAKT